MKKLIEQTMFEKESKKYSDYVKYTHERWGSNYPNYGDIEIAYQKGADFGYNKANEWHYVKDGKYPTDEKDVEVLYQDCDKINVYNCVYDIHAENWLYYNLDDMMLELFPFNVIAWKEVVLPELNTK